MVWEGEVLLITFSLVAKVVTQDVGNLHFQVLVPSEVGKGFEHGPAISWVSVPTTRLWNILTWDSSNLSY